ncbi:hypothetical protein [Sphaerisporangium sp. NPDC051011]
MSARWARLSTGTSRESSASRRRAAACSSACRSPEAAAVTAMSRPMDTSA